MISTKLSKYQDKNMLNIIQMGMKSRYDIDEKVKASGLYECSLCEYVTAFKRGEMFTRCDNCAPKYKKKVNQWITTNEFIHFFSKNINFEFDKIASIQFKIAEKIAGWAGTVEFFTFHVIWFGLWILINLGKLGSQYVFDPYPFGLLTMIVSLEAIFLSTFIMITQNISGQKSELRAEHEYQVNLNTEKQVAELHAMVKELIEQNEKK
jgi:uncharacterized membrane protein